MYTNWDLFILQLHILASRLNALMVAISTAWACITRVHQEHRHQEMWKFGAENFRRQITWSSYTVFVVSGANNHRDAIIPTKDYVTKTWSWSFVMHLYAWRQLLFDQVEQSTWAQMTYYRFQCWWSTQYYMLTKSYIAKNHVLGRYQHLYSHLDGHFIACIETRDPEINTIFIVLLLIARMPTWAKNEDHVQGWAVQAVGHHVDNYLKGVLDILPM
jgi:hypothetical protein